MQVSRANVESIHGTMYHRSARNADGTPCRCRVNGRVKLWKTRPAEFRLPVKHGLYDYFYIDQNNCEQWFTTEEEATVASAAQRWMERQVQRDISRERLLLLS